MYIIPILVIISISSTFGFVITISDNFKLSEEIKRMLKEREEDLSESSNE